MHTLQDQYRETFFFRRAGNQIQAVPLHDGAALPSGRLEQVPIAQARGLFSRLLEEGIRRRLRTLYLTLQIPVYGPLIFDIVGAGHDLVCLALANNRNALSKVSFFHIYRQYRLLASHFTWPADEEPTSGLLIAVGSSWHFSASIADLVAKGIDVTGCYAVPLGPDQKNPRIGKRSLGRISKIIDSQAYLVDAREDSVIPTDQYTIEASLTNVTRCLAAILLGQSQHVLTQIHKEVGQLVSAQGQINRIQMLAKIVSEKDILCAAGLTARLSPELTSVPSASQRATLVLEPPRYVLRYGSSPVAGPIATALASQGPFDQDSFKKTTPFVAIITPKQYLGRVEQFLRAWRDGSSEVPYYIKGFKQQYRLRGCDFHIVDFQQMSGSPTEDYRQACHRALEESQEAVRRYDLAFVVVEERHRLLWQQDPYLVAKAVLMNREVPVQALEIETVNAPLRNQRFTFNNLGVACYTKMGGMPWLLAASKGQGIAHELIVGLGFTSLGPSRLGERERFVGITTLFNYDGVYQVSHLSQESTFDEYSQALQATLLSSIKYVSIQKGWQPGDRVRLIFHTAQQLRNLEIEAVKRLVQENLSAYTVDFAFLVLGHQHEWSLYDPGSPGVMRTYYLAWTTGSQTGNSGLSG